MHIVPAGKSVAGSIAAGRWTGLCAEPNAELTVKCILRFRKRCQASTSTHNGMSSPAITQNTLRSRLPNPVLSGLRKHQTLSATLLLFAVLSVCFFPFIWGNKTLLAVSSGGVPGIVPSGAWYGRDQAIPVNYRGHDMGAAGWVLEAYPPLIHHQYFTEKRLPLWNPYQAYGTPLAAAMQTQPFSPLNLLFALHPGPRTLNFFVLTRLLLAGLFTYLYLRLFLPFSPSLAGGITYMLSGYFILLYNMPHLSVEVLLPAVFLTTERLLRGQYVRNVLFSVCVILFCIVSGMPESTLLALSFSYTYFIFRLLSDKTLRCAAGKHLRYFVFVNAAGFALAAFLLLPFMEFMRISFDMHQPQNRGDVLGIKHLRLGISAFTYVMPALFGPAGKPMGPGLGGDMQGYMGILPFLFALLAAGSLWHRRHFRNAAGRSITVFFLLSTAALFLKEYGSPLVNWVGRLPLFQLVFFLKYEHPLLAFSVATLCAFGIDHALMHTVSRRRMTASILIAFLLPVAVLKLSWPAVAAAKADDYMYYRSLGGAVAVIFLCTLVLLGPGDRRAQALRWMPTVLIALLVVEMAGSYLYPVYYLQGPFATVESNPYRGAPYLDYLKSRMGDNSRIFGRDMVLFPNWASSFQLADIRGLDAMYYRKYFPFVRAFLHEDLPPDDSDLVDRFTGTYTYNFDTPLQRRLLQLSSVKYLLSMSPYTPESPFIRSILQWNRAHLAPGIGAQAFTIGRESKPVLFEHPPYERLPFRKEITAATRQFSFSIGIQPAVYDGSYPLCGDGVEFRLEIRDSSGRIAPLYSRYIDPKHNPAERRWISETVDLNQYMDQNVELLFTTLPGPAGDTCMDWAGWGDPHFNGDVQMPASFRPVYDHEIKIYQYDDILPRAALFSQVEFAADQAAALNRLTSPSFDIFQTALVSPADLNGQEVAAIKDMQRLSTERVRPARIVSYASQEVKIDAVPDRPSLLVLNDSDYPGWKVYVDGQRSKLITANYLFRGVLLKPGRHIVRFSYEPLSFTAGMSIAGAGLIGLAAFVVSRKRQPIKS